MAVAQGFGALGQVLFTLSVGAGAVEMPSPVVDALADLTYAPPLIVALFSYPRPKERLISRFRGALDALVITTRRRADQRTHRAAASAGRTDVGGARSGDLAYPVADIAICAARRPSACGSRRRSADLVLPGQRPGESWL